MKIKVIKGHLFPQYDSNGDAELLDAIHIEHRNSSDWMEVSDKDFDILKDYYEEKNRTRNYSDTAVYLILEETSEKNVKIDIVDALKTAKAEESKRQEKLKKQMQTQQKRRDALVKKALEVKKAKEVLAAAGISLKGQLKTLGFSAACKEYCEEDGDD